jgi:RHH-type transcriptional regulator, proline utilization regulon repressor / proline dehydrogenase / delta 1-pyrroline-5-carboxylate dehydrogenase
MIAEGSRVRYAHPERVPDIIAVAAAKQSASIVATSPVTDGRIEMAIGGYFQEQVISDRFHRYGNLLHRDPAIHN